MIPAFWGSTKPNEPPSPWAWAVKFPQHFHVLQANGHPAPRSHRLIDSVALPAEAGRSWWPHPYPSSDPHGTAAEIQCWCTPVGWRTGRRRRPSHWSECRSVQPQAQHKLSTKQCSKCTHFMYPRTSGKMHQKSSQGRKWQFSDTHCKFPTEKTIGARNFHLALEFPKCGFQSQTLQFWTKIIWRDFRTIFRQPKMHGEVALSLCHNAISQVPWPKKLRCRVCPPAPNPTEKVTIWV